MIPPPWPCSRGLDETYQPLVDGFANQNFIAALRGDLTGNWTP